MTTAVARAGAARPRAPRRRVPPGRMVREVLFYLAVAIVVLIALFPFYWILRTLLLSNTQVSAGVGGANGIIPSRLSDPGGTRSAERMLALLPSPAAIRRGGAF